MDYLECSWRRAPAKGLAGTMTNPLPINCAENEFDRSDVVSAPDAISSRDAQREEDAS